METSPLPGADSQDTEIFSPGDAPIINAPDTDDIINQVPDDIEDFLAQNKIKKNGYSCQVKRVLGDGKKPSLLPGDFTNRIPTLHEVGSWHGPGEYLYSFAHKTTTAGGGKKTNQTAEYPFELGPEWADIHKQYKLNKRIAQHRENLRRIQDEKLEASLETSNGDTLNVPSPKSELATLMEAAQTLKALNVEFGGSGKEDTSIRLFIEQQKAATEQARLDARAREEREDRRNDFLLKIVGAVAPFIAPIIADKLKSQPAYDPQKNLENTMKMIGQIVDFKQDLTPEKETMTDKIFGMIQEVAPMLLEMAAVKGAAAVSQSKTVQAAKKSKEFKEVTEDSVSLQHLITRMYEEFGPDDTNLTLQVLGVPLKINAEGRVTPVVKGEEPTAAAKPNKEPDPGPNPEHDLEPANPPPPEKGGPERAGQV